MLLTPVKKLLPLLDCFDVDLHGDDLNPLTSPLVAHSAAPSHRPKYGHVCRARCRAAGWKRWEAGGRGEKKGGKKRARRRGLEILESPRQRVHDTKGTKGGFNRRNVSSDIV